MPSPRRLYSDSHAEIWIGNSLDPEHAAEIMGGRKADTLIFDAPFSERTHSGHANGKLTADRAAAFAEANKDDPTPESRYSARKSEHGESGRRDIDYPHFTPEDVKNFSDIWVPITNGWCVSITDDVLAPTWRSSLEAHGRYGFAPLPLVETGSRVRMAGDGPSGWTCWIMVARPRHEPYSKWGTLPGCYIQTAERKFNSRNGSDRVVGGKPLRSMVEIVGDYSRKGELVVDPCVGGGTTIVAAKMLGRKGIGIDKDEKHAAIAVEQLMETKEQVMFQW